MKSYQPTSPHNVPGNLGFSIQELERFFSVGALPGYVQGRYVSKSEVFRLQAHFLALMEAYRFRRAELADLKRYRNSLEQELHLLRKVSFSTSRRPRCRKRLIPLVRLVTHA